MFAQLFKTIDDYDNIEKFEDNVKITFDKIINQLKEWCKTSQELEGFIMQNLLFTIIACFKEKDSYIVKTFGDGYIITQNIYGNISYIQLYYKKTPPYYAYKYSNMEDNVYKDYKFKSFKFAKEKFLKVGIATDGVMPIAKGEIEAFDRALRIGQHIRTCEQYIRNNRQLFFDDISIGIFDMGGNSDGKNS